MSGRVVPFPNPSPKPVRVQPLHTPGPWIFEPHNGYSDEAGRYPFGYISTSHPSPIFELRTPLVWPERELEANVHLMAAAPDLAEALDWLLACIETKDADHAERLQLAIHGGRIALKKALGDE